MPISEHGPGHDVKPETSPSNTMSKSKVLICPYCGDTQPAGQRCRVCAGLFEPLSRQASHNAMGPWYVRDEKRPFQPGCSYETLVRLVDRGQINKYSILRGPTTKQFWTVARRVPGISHLLGYCHNCDASVDADDHGCHACGVPFGAYLDRNYLGLPDVRPLPWELSGSDEPVRQVKPSATPDFRRAAEPLGLSSFASDVELRGGGGAGGAGRPEGDGGSDAGVDAGGDGGDDDAGERALSGVGAPASMPRWATPVESAVDGGGALQTLATASELRTQPGTGLLESSARALAARSMQQRLRRQQRTIRVLALAMVVFAIIAVGCIYAMLSLNAKTGGDGTRARDSQGRMPAAGAGDEISQAAVDGGGAAPGEDASGDSMPGSDAALDPTNPPPPVAPPVPAAPADFSAFEADHTRAQELIKAAADAERPRKDRIIDYEQALAILKRISEQAPAQAQPQGLAEQIKQVEKQLERLRLEEFFP